MYKFDLKYNKIDLKKRDKKLFKKAIRNKKKKKFP